MADVSIKYKGVTVAELAEGQSKTLKTAGTYCENDIDISYTPNFRMYDVSITTDTAAIWHLLIELDSETLAHINDPAFTVFFTIYANEHTYQWYSGSSFSVSNTPLMHQNEHPIYGYSSREQTETVPSPGFIMHPANYTGTSILGGYGAFRIEGNKYYVRPTDGFLKKGNYKLIFYW